MTTTKRDPRLEAAKVLKRALGFSQGTLLHSPKGTPLLEMILTTYFHDLSWERYTDSLRKGAWARLPFKNENDEQILCVMEFGEYPTYRCKFGGPYGEMIFSLAGEVCITYPNNKKIKLLAGEHAVFPPDQRYVLSADAFWFGYIHRPQGSTPFPL